MVIDRLIDRIIELKNPSVIGLDTDFSYIPQETAAKCNTLADAAEAITEFNIDIIEKIKDIAPAVKVQIAYYEKYGVAGLKAFNYTLEAAKEAGLYVIADCKRNDIGSTAAAYSAAYLGRTEVNGNFYNAFPTDFLTVNAYLGSDGIKPFVADSLAYDKGIFVLVKTSNFGSAELQNLVTQSGKTVYMEMAELVSSWGAPLIGKHGYSAVGAVVGATHKEEAEIIRKAYPSLFFLIPGYGAQGGNADDIRCSFDGLKGGIINNSRGILTAYRNPKYSGQGFADAARSAAFDMQKDLYAALIK